MVSTPNSRQILTSLSNEQEEPYTPCEIQQQGSRIFRIPQQVGDGEKSTVQLALDPRGLDSRGVKERMRGRAVGAGSSADEGRGETPGQTDEDEAEDVIENRGFVVRHGGLMVG